MTKIPMIPQRSFKETLRSHVWSAIERGGINLDPVENEVYLNERLVSTRSFATEIVELLERISPPATAAERSFMRGVPMMTAFACTVIDCLYRMFAYRTDSREAVRRLFSIFIVGSAAFDYVCDSGSDLLPALKERISVEKLQSSFRSSNFHPFMQSGDSGFVCYATLLAEKEVMLCQRVLTSRVCAEPDEFRNSLVEILIRIYGSELSTVPFGDSSAIDIAHNREIVWTEPIKLALLFISIVSDARPGATDIDKHMRVLEVGRLLSLVDDALDIEEDSLRSKRSFSSIHANGSVTSIDISTGLPLERLLTSQTIESHMNRITRSAARASDSTYSRDLAGWLYSWLRP